MSPVHSALRRPRHAAGFTLAETLISIAITVLSLAAFFAATGQAIRIVRSGKEIAAASQMLQQRIETFRYSHPWTNVTTETGISNLVKTDASTASTFSNATETFTIVPYPAGGTPLVVTRSPQGAIASSGPSLATEKCVRVTAAVTWTGNGGVQRTREVSTIMTKGGL
jgi:type II secretory pathway pseudopilin PulG